MEIEKQSFVDKIEVLSSGVVQVRTATKILENGEIISQSLHRHMICPGDDFSQEHEKVKAICSAIHTADVIASFKSSRLEKGV